MREGTQEATTCHIHGGLAERPCAAQFGANHCDAVATTCRAECPSAALRRGRDITDGRTECLQNAEASCEISLVAVAFHQGAWSVHERAAAGMEVDREVMPRQGNGFNQEGVLGGDVAVLVAGLAAFHVASIIG